MPAESGALVVGALGVLAPQAVFHGRYRVIAALRAGGMGAVYEVLDERTGAPRALKIVHPDLLHHSGASEEYRARFAHEATVTGMIESDHIVRVLDAGVDDATGMPFLTMELLRGLDLAALVEERGALSAAEVCTYLGQASIALDKTHAAGIVHRDLKPENLFLTQRDDGSPCVKILDFGIAKTTRVGSGVETTGIVGSPLYMAPEQLLLDQPLGPPVDVYALGQTAYTLLVGEPYWRPEFERASSPIAAALHLSAGIPEPFSTRARHRKNLDLPGSLDAWFAKCVARSPADRFASASSAVVSLAEALGLTSAAPAPARPRPLPRPGFARGRRRWRRCDSYPARRPPALRVSRHRRRGAEPRARRGLGVLDGRPGQGLSRGVPAKDAAALGQTLVRPRGHLGVSRAKTRGRRVRGENHGARPAKWLRPLGEHHLELDHENAIGAHVRGAGFARVFVFQGRSRGRPLAARLALNAPPNASIRLSPGKTCECGSRAPRPPAAAPAAPFRARP